MERGAKKVSEMRPIDDTKDRQLIERIIDKHDYEPMDDKKLKKFIEEKRHKIKRTPKKPTKITENNTNTINNTEQINKPSQLTSSKRINNDSFKLFKFDDKETKIKDDLEDNKSKTLKTSIKKPTKVKRNYESDSDSDSDSNNDSEEDNKPKTPIKKSSKVNTKVESEEESLSKIQLLNQELFKENSNKSRNETIKNAWKSLTEYELPNKQNLIIKKSYPGHFVTMGSNAGSLKNPHWLVMNEKGDEYYIMYCETDGYTKFSIEDYKEVINPDKHIYPTWSYHSTGYISTRSYKSTDTMTYLHQVICKKHNEKKYATLSVDHKNRDKLDNRNQNLRFATQSEQNQNTDKRNRKYNAKKLPDGLKQEDMPKYVLYYSEMYGPNKDKFREWINIEKHPKQNSKRWSSSKSMAITIQEKLEQAKAKLEELDL